MSKDARERVLAKLASMGETAPESLLAILVANEQKIIDAEVAIVTAQAARPRKSISVIANQGKQYIIPAAPSVDEKDKYNAMCEECGARCMNILFAWNNRCRPIISCPTCLHKFLVEQIPPSVYKAYKIPVDMVQLKYFAPILIGANPFREKKSKKKEEA